jgi:hypothetical protein
VLLRWCIPEALQTRQLRAKLPTVPVQLLLLLLPLLLLWGCLRTSPLDHMSTPKVYLVDPSRISGARYQRVAT